jgi:hypothetical protein
MGMRQLKQVLLLAVVLFGFSAKADVSNSENLCFALEGVPLPFCKFTRFHTCNSGGPSVCIYSKLENVITTYSDPSVGLCANNNQTCTNVCTNGPDGQTCALSCQCNDPVPVPTPCRQDCGKCIAADQNFNSQVYCEEFCGDPTCPGTFDHPTFGRLQRSGSSLSTCQGNRFCAAPGPSNPNAPTEVSQCPNQQLPPPEPFDPAKCCYQGGDPVPSHAVGLPRCPAG